MEPEEADDVRMLLAYDPDTAGGLMTTEPIIVSADATVAEGLALIRRHELAPALGAAVCVTLPPYEPPTGRFLGVVHFQRMLRYPPHERLGTLLDTSTVVWVKELGDGRLHDYKSVPFVIAGSGNGYWKLGRYLQMGGAPHQKLLVSLCQSMGVQVDGFGVPDITGGIPELTS